ncbi:hypothetical protein GW916_14335 [bacterium]|nr:hypothetical protein [bacterium]
MTQSDHEIDIALKSKLQSSSRPIPAAPSDEFSRILSRRPSRGLLSWTQLVPLSLGIATMCWLLIFNQSSNHLTNVTESEIDAFVLDSYSVTFQSLEDQELLGDASAAYYF